MIYSLIEEVNSPKTKLQSMKIIDPIGGNVNLVCRKVFSTNPAVSRT
jgi:hypothetical protein